MKEVIFDILRVVFTNPDVLQLLGFAISVMLLWLIKQGISLMGMKLRAERMTALSTAIDRAMTFAIVRAEDTIREKGWDSKDSRIEVLNRTVPILAEKFSDTLRRNGIDLNDEAHRIQIREQMERMLPDIFTRAAASPATPPAMVVPVAAVSPPAGA